MIDIEELWRKHHTTLIRYMRRRLPKHEAEDMVQRVFLLALEAAARGKAYNDNASGWLFRIAHNAVIDRYRARGREPEWLDIDELYEDETWEDGRNPALRAEAVTDKGLSPHEQVERSIASEQVRKAIVQLPETQSMVTVWRMYGYEYEEIAEGMHKSYGAVKGIQVRAYAGLREVLVKEAA